MAIIPEGAQCCMCKEFEEDPHDNKRGRCAVAREAAIEGLTVAGITAMYLDLWIAWNAKPCEDGWEPSYDGQQEADRFEAQAESERRAA